MNEPLQWTHLSGVRPEHVSVRPGPSGVTIHLGPDLLWWDPPARVRETLAEVDRQLPPVRPTSEQVDAVLDRYDRYVGHGMKRPAALHLATDRVLGQVA